MGSRQTRERTRKHCLTVSLLVELWSFLQKDDAPKNEKIEVKDVGDAQGKAEYYAQHS